MAKKDLAPFGTRLRRLARAAGITSQKWFLEQVGISAMTLHRYEVGEREPPASTIVAMTKVLGCSADELLGLPTARGIRFPEGTPADDLVKGLMPISVALRDLVWAMTTGSDVVRPKLFAAEAFVELAEAVREWPLLRRIEALKEFAATVEKEIPARGVAADMPDLPIQEILRHATAREEAFKIAAELQAIYAAVLWAAYPVLADHDDLFEHPGTADLAEVEELRQLVEHIDPRTVALGLPGEPVTKRG